MLLHTSLYDRQDAPLGPQTCYWRTMLPTVDVVDWMEWQAGYLSGALLMPETFIRRAVMAYFHSRKINSSVARDSREAAELAQRVSLIFESRPRQRACASASLASCATRPPNSPP